MKPEILQSISQIAIFVGIMITAFGGWGSYYYGNKSDNKVRGELNIKIDSLLDGNNELNKNLEPFKELAQQRFPELPIEEALESLSNDYKKIKDRLEKEINTIKSFSSDLEISFTGNWKEDPFPGQIMGGFEHEYYVNLISQDKNDRITFYAEKPYQFTKLKEYVKYSSTQVVKDSDPIMGKQIDLLKNIKMFECYMPLILAENLSEKKILIKNAKLSFHINGKLYAEIVLDRPFESKVTINNNFGWATFGFEIKRENGFNDLKNNFW